MVVLLNRLPVKDCLKLCHLVVDGLCGLDPPQWKDYSDTWSLEEWIQLMERLNTLMCLTGRDNYNHDQVLAGLSGVDAGHAQVVLEVLRGRRPELRAALLRRTHYISSSVLQDFDWQLKLALSSDKLSCLHTPLLSLSLDVREGGAQRPVTVEMNREELNTLITSLEAANKVMLQLK